MSTLPIISPQTPSENLSPPIWNLKKLFIKDYAIRVFSCAQEHFNTAADRYRLDIDKISEMSEIAAEKTQTILLRFLMVLSDEQVPQVKAHL